MKISEPRCSASSFSPFVQMWMCDEINVAQVKRADGSAARPHGSLSAHIQIIRHMLQLSIFFFCVSTHNPPICFFYFTAPLLLLEYMFRANYSHCSHFAHETLLKRPLTRVNYVLRSVVSNNHSQQIYILIYLSLD